MSNKLVPKLQEKLSVYKYAFGTMSNKMVPKLEVNFINFRATFGTSKFKQVSKPKKINSQHVCLWKLDKYTETKGRTYIPETKRT